MQASQLRTQIEELFAMGRSSGWTVQTERAMEALISGVNSHAHGQAKKTLLSYVRDRELEKNERLMVVILLRHWGFSMTDLSSTAYDLLNERLYRTDFLFAVKHLLDALIPMPSSLVYDIVERVIFSLPSAYTRISKQFQRVPKRLGKQVTLFLTLELCRVDLTRQNKDMIFAILSHIDEVLPENVATVANGELDRIKNDIPGKVRTIGLDRIQSEAAVVEVKNTPQDELRAARPQFSWRGPPQAPRNPKPQIGFEKNEGDQDQDSPGQTRESDWKPRSIGEAFQSGNDNQSHDDLFDRHAPLSDQEDSGTPPEVTWKRQRLVRDEDEGDRDIFSPRKQQGPQQEYQSGQGISRNFENQDQADDRPTFQNYGSEEAVSPQVRKLELQGKDLRGQDIQVERLGGPRLSSSHSGPEYVNVELSEADLTMGEDDEGISLRDWEDENANLETLAQVYDSVLDKGYGEIADEERDDPDFDERMRILEDEKASESLAVREQAALADEDPTNSSPRVQIEVDPGATSQTPPLDPDEGSDEDLIAIEQIIPVRDTKGENKDDGSLVKPERVPELQDRSSQESLGPGPWTRFVNGVKKALGMDRGDREALEEFRLKDGPPPTQENSDGKSGSDSQSPGAEEGESDEESPGGSRKALNKRMAPRNVVVISLALAAAIAAGVALSNNGPSPVPLADTNDGSEVVDEPSIPEPIAEPIPDSQESDPGPQASVEPSEPLVIDGTILPPLDPNWTPRLDTSGPRGQWTVDPDTYLWQLYQYLKAQPELWSSPEALESVNWTEFLNDFVELNPQIQDPSLLFPEQTLTIPLY